MSEVLGGGWHRHPDGSVSRGAVDTLMRRADRALWRVDPEYAQTLGIKAPTEVDTGSMRQSYDGGRRE